MAKIIVIGGGAAGFFFAINASENNPTWEVLILEKTTELLEKVRVSGGGRCNVSHACFDPKELTKFYPRGQKELLGAFHRFGPADTINWFEERGVELKTETDNRMFPVSDNSETIVTCFLETAKELGIKIWTKQEVDKLSRTAENWLVETASGDQLTADIVFIATGSSLRMWDILRKLEFEIVPPVPSLFTFHIKDDRINGLQGLSVNEATVSIPSLKLNASGPLLITHWGMSGPAILRLSAWGARLLKENKYQFELQINWCGDNSTASIIDFLMDYKLINPKRNLDTHTVVDMPLRLWKKLLPENLENKKWADISNKQIEVLATNLTKSTFSVNGKSTFKEEFVTSGGVALHQIDFKNFQSKKHPNLYFGGEVLDIDAITGGFNFQAAWTGAWIAANNLNED